MNIIRHPSPRGLHLPGRCVRCDHTYRARTGLPGSGLLTPAELDAIPERLQTAELDDAEFAAQQAALVPTGNGLRVPWGWASPTPTE